MNRTRGARLYLGFPSVMSTQTAIRMCASCDTSCLSGFLENSNETLHTAPLTGKSSHFLFSYYEHDERSGFDASLRSLGRIGRRRLNILSGT